MSREFLNKAKKREIWRWPLYLLIAAGVLASLLVGLQRMALESTSKTTLLALEWGQLKDTAARNGSTVEQALRQLTQDEAGRPLISGVVYKEPMLNDWQNGGYLQVVTGAQLLDDVRVGGWEIAATPEAEIRVSQPVEPEAEDGGPLDNNHNYVICYDEQQQQLVFNNLEYKTSAQNSLYTLVNADDELLYVVSTTYPYTDLAALGIGFSAEDTALIKSRGLSLVVQVRSWPSVTPESLEFVFGDIASLGAQAVGFNDNELPGVQQANWPELSQQLAEILRRQGLPSMSIEFFNQTGLQSFLQKMDYDMVRMHPVSEAELPKLADTRLQERFALAANERGMDVMLLRLRSGQTLADSVEYIAAVRDAIQAKGVSTNHMTVVPDMHVYQAVLLLAFAAVWAGGVLLLKSFDLRKSAWLLSSLGLALLAALLVVGKAYLAQKLAALAAVVIFPYLGVASAARPEGRSLPLSILTLCRITLTSLLGAALVVGMLSERSYMSAINTFSGVKVGQLAALLLLMIYLLYQLANEHGGAGYLLVGCWRLLQKKVTIGLVLLAGMAAMLLLYYMLRTGNTSVGVSDLERSFRAFLDKVLVVRPRTKEFMFAHPIMLVVLYYGYRRQLWPLVLLGAIGQVSLVNTFEHLHTPLLVSLVRTANGLVLGIILGVVLIYLLKYPGAWLLRKVREVARLAELADASDAAAQEADRVG